MISWPGAGSGGGYVRLPNALGPPQTAVWFGTITVLWNEAWLAASLAKAVAFEYVTLLQAHVSTNAYISLTASCTYDAGGGPQTIGLDGIAQLLDNNSQDNRLDGVAVINLSTDHTVSLTFNCSDVLIPCRSNFAAYGYLP
jgi:hypothetical protein